MLIRMNAILTLLCLALLGAPAQSRAAGESLEPEVLLATATDLGFQPAPVLASPLGLDVGSQSALGAVDEFTGRHALGVMLGLTSGIGLSYRHYLTDRFAVRGAGYVIYLKDTFTLWHLGAMVQYDFRRDSRFVLYGLGGIGLARAKDPAGESTLLTLDLGLYPGAGIGIELGEHGKPGFTYQIELVGTVRAKNGELAELGLLPLPQLGVHYTF